jgi:hypothetical protein
MPSRCRSKVVTRRGATGLMWVCSALAALWPAAARADLELTEKEGWKLSIDGRVNSFLSHTWGTGVPPKMPDYTGIDDTPTKDNEIVSTRVRTGFITSVFGLRLKKELQHEITVTGRVALWMLVASTRAKNDIPPVDARELYVQIDSPAGQLLAGKNLSLFPRGAILINYEYAHNYGLGHPCSPQLVLGGACGHAGHGTTFPGFNAGIIYTTPELGGLALSLGMYDPSTIAVGRYERTPYPRFEGELTFKAGDVFHAFGHGFWQRLERTDTDPMTSEQVDKDVSARGLGGGLGVAIGPVRLGGSGYFGKGMGAYLPVENNPIVVDDEGTLRDSFGYYAQSALVIEGTQISAGVGVTQIKKTDFDPDADELDMSGQPGNPKLLKRQLGVSFGVYQQYGPLVFAAEYFRGEYLWHDYGEIEGTEIVVKRPQQAVNFVNAGVTLHW